MLEGAMVGQVKILAPLDGIVEAGQLKVEKSGRFAVGSIVPSFQLTAIFANKSLLAKASVEE